MDQEAFLAAVVPWGTGNVTIKWRRSDRKWPERRCPSLSDALLLLRDIAVGKNDVFFGLATQHPKSDRHRGETSTALCAAWIDMDVDPADSTKYPDIYEAIADLLYFCQRFALPPPSIIVASGGGIHAYWLSDRTLSVEEWRPFAEALKTAAARLPLKIDAAVTADVVRVLRVPYTYNYKYDPPRPVKILQEYSLGERYDFSTMFAELLKLTPEKPILSRPKDTIKVAEAFKKLDPTAKKLGEGIEFDNRPLPLDPILKECGFLREAYETGGEKYANPLWNLTNLCAVFLEDGQALAHKFGNRHPTYTEEETNQAFARKQREHEVKGIGWPRCKVIADAGSVHCKTCKHFLSGKSPLHIGHSARPAAAAAATFSTLPAPESEDDAELALLGGSRPPDLRLPPGYAVNSHGRICAFFPSAVNGKKVVPGRLLPLFSSRFENVSLQAHNGSLGLAFTATVDSEASVNVFLNVNSCCNKQSLFKTLGERNIGHISDPEVETMGVKFTSSWLDLLTQEDKALPDQGGIGWHYDLEGERIGFAYGNVLYRRDGEQLPLRTGTDDEFRAWYTPKGKRTTWLKAAKLLTGRQRPELDILLSIPFATPLTVFAGTLYGTVLSVWGDPGTSKSTAQQVAAAVWGHPKQTRESLNSTPKSVQGRLGRTKNLPAYWDDIQDERHQQMLFDCMFVTTEGTEGGRLNPDASYKQRLEWQTLLVACSNASFVDYLTKRQKSTTAGMRRVFEVYFPRGDNEPGMINAVDASQTFAELEHNYGVIGAEYARILAREQADINMLVTGTIKQFCRKVQGTGDEFYWWSLCGCLLSGATLAKRLGAEMDVRAMEEFLVTAFLENRRIRGTEGTDAGSYLNTEQSLTAFMNHFIGSGNRIVTDRAYRNRRDVIDILQEPGINRPIYIQIIRDERTIIISKRAMREFLWANEIQPKQVFAGMVKYLKACECRLTLGAGTAFAYTQESCFEIVVPIGQLDFLEHLLNVRGKAQ